MTITIIYEYLLEIETPENFHTGFSFPSSYKYKNYTKNKAKYTTTTKTVSPNISVMEQLEDILHTQEFQIDNKSSKDEHENNNEDLIE